MENPRYKHDCEACTFLGQYEDDDLYHCPQHGMPTLIARHSDKPADYTSFLAEIIQRDFRQFRWQCPALAEALRRASNFSLALGGGAVG